MKVTGCIALMAIVIALVLLVTLDMRHGGALIEKPMIKIYDKFPTEKALTKALHWQAKNPFPLRELISNGTISIDTAFKVDEMTLAPIYVKMGSLTFRPKGADSLTMNYIGQLDPTVRASGIGRLTSVSPPFMYEGEFNNNGQPNGFGRFISENVLV